MVTVPSASPSARALSRLSALVLSLAATLSPWASTPAQASYVFNTVSQPGAHTTGLFDINDAGLMVGYASTGSGAAEVTQGFIYDGTSFTTLTGPAGALGSFALGISAAGTVVGSYFTTQSLDVDGNVDTGPSTGFIFIGGLYVSLEVAGATDTFLRGISADGRYITGYYAFAGKGIGFVLDTATSLLQHVSDPDSLLTIPQGIRNGIVVGSDVIDGSPVTRPGFTYDIGTGTRTDVMIAGAQRTALRTIEDDGDIGGWFIDAAGDTHGFIGSIASHEVIDFAGADATFVEGSNAAKTLVGNFSTATGVSGAFIATASQVPEPAAWTLLLVAAAAAGLRRRDPV